MHKSFNTIALAGIATALALTPVMVTAQDDSVPDTAPEAEAPATDMTSEQDAEMQGWPAEKQTAFKTWPAETQTYYWSLSPDRQKKFWALSDSDKVTLSTMAEPQRESIWAQIDTQVDAPSA